MVIQKKFKVDGTMEKHEAIFVEKGYLYVQGIYY